MDGREYTSLVAALAAVPDPRHRRGQRYGWTQLLTLIVAAVASGERHGRGIGQWVEEHAPELQVRLGLRRMPSEATLRRVLRTVEVPTVEQAVRRWTASRAAVTRQPLMGVAVDGKEVRGAGRHGPPVVLVGLVRHDGLVLDQEAAPSPLAERTAVQRLVERHALTGVVVTADALLADRALAAQIRAQQGHYLFVIKGNQPVSQHSIAALFARASWTRHERAQEYRQHRTVEKGHGRLEIRDLEASSTLNAWLDWPDLGQVLKRTTRRVRLATGEVQAAVTYGVTSLTPRAASAAELERLWRGHWHIENQVHYVRDVTWGEDAGQAYRGHTPQALAALRNAVLNLLRLHGWRRIADARRHYAAHLDETLTLIGVPARL
jgi:predicted transposase YbfD/YdcC